MGILWKSALVVTALYCLSLCDEERRTYGSVVYVQALRLYTCPWFIIIVLFWMLSTCFVCVLSEIDTLVLCVSFQMECS